MRLYERLAADIEGLIRDGTLMPGARVPSIRQVCREHAVSAASAVRAFELLEARGLLQSRARSGFFVATRAPAPHRAVVAPRPARVDVSELVFQILESTRAADVVPLGSAFPAPELFPLRQLGRHLAYVGQHLDPRSTVEHLPPGSATLRAQIAQRYRLQGAQVGADEIIITAGALEALTLALQVTTRPDDIVAIESPCFYGCLQAIEGAGRRALEIPSQPQRGLDLAALRHALDHYPVRACWVMTNFQSPLGATVSDAGRQQLVELLARHRIPLIEDDLYAELYFTRQRPRSTKVWDQAGLVLNCGSFAKSLAPGYRLGWVAAGGFAEAVRHRKITTSLATSIPIQAAVSRYLASGVFERHLRALRRRLAAQLTSLVGSLERHFPKGCDWTAPSGGYQLWVRLPPGADALALQAQALVRGVSVAPGPIFSPQRAFRQAIRLNFGHPWTARSEAAVATLADLIRAQTARPRARSTGRRFGSRE